MLRRRRSWPTIGATLFAILVSAMVAGQEPYQNVTEFEDALAWFEELGFPDVMGRPFVEVTARNAVGNGSTVRSVVSSSKNDLWGPDDARWRAIVK
jgi:hypothetical protein